MKNLWYIDGMDLFQTFGLIIEEGTADLLRPPKRKEGIVHDWMDAHGKEYDTDNFFFDERKTVLKLGMLAESETLFWQYYQKFMSLISAPGLRRLEITAHGNRQYYFIYDDSSSINQVVPLTGKLTGFVGQKFSITIIEPQPATTAEPLQALSDEDGRIIIT